MKKHINTLFFIIFLFLIEFISFTKEKGSFSPDKCDITSEGPVSIGDGERLFIPQARPDGLIIKYDFEDEILLNKVGNKYYPKCEKKLKYVSGYGGSGLAALFNQNYCEDETKFNLDEDFSITFYIYFLKTIASQYQILYKGNTKKTDNSFDISFNVPDRRLELMFTSKKENQKEVLFLNSIGRLSAKKWYHISIVKNNYEIVLYINGIKNNNLILTNIHIENNKYPIFLGNTKKISDEEFDYYYLDEFKIYQKSISKDYIQAEASILLGGNAPSYYEIGCSQCNITEAENNCTSISNYRLCSSIELYSGGINVLNDFGLVIPDTLVWTNAMAKEKEKYENKIGTGLCCSIIK